MVGEKVHLLGRVEHEPRQVVFRPASPPSAAAAAELRALWGKDVVCDGAILAIGPGRWSISGALPGSLQIAADVRATGSCHLGKGFLLPGAALWAPGGPPPGGRRRGCPRPVAQRQAGWRPPATLSFVEEGACARRLTEGESFGRLPGGAGTISTLPPAESELDARLDAPTPIGELAPALAELSPGARGLVLKQAIPEMDGDFPGKDASIRRRRRVAGDDGPREP